MSDDNGSFASSGEKRVEEGNNQFLQLPYHYYQCFLLYLLDNMGAVGRSLSFLSLRSKCYVFGELSREGNTASKTSGEKRHNMKYSAALPEDHNDDDDDEEEEEVEIQGIMLVDMHPTSHTGCDEESHGEGHRNHEVLESKPAESLFVSAMSNIGVQYNYSDISLALAFLERDYPTANLGWDMVPILKTVVLVGSIFGMITMGTLGDQIGRNHALVVTSLLAGFGALVSAIAAWGPPKQLYVGIVVCRFFLGVGLGGVYPLTG